MLLKGKIVHHTAKSVKLAEVVISGKKIKLRTICFFSYFSVFSVPSVVNYYKILMHRTNEATDTDLKVIERLRQIGWKWGEIKCRY